MAAPSKHGQLFYDVMTNEEQPSCSFCGACCSGEQQWGVIVTTQRYEKWIEEERDDILSHVEASVNGLHYAIIWKNPETDEFLPHCPFLETYDEGKFCKIQETKPEICHRFWCAWSFGEGKKGTPFYTVNGWTREAQERGYSD